MPLSAILVCLCSLLTGIMNSSRTILLFPTPIASVLLHGESRCCCCSMCCSFCDIYVNMNSSRFSKELADFLEPDYQTYKNREHYEFFESFIPSRGMEESYLMDAYAKVVETESGIAPLYGFVGTLSSMHLRECSNARGSFTATYNMTSRKSLLPR